MKKEFLHNLLFAQDDGAGAGASVDSNSREGTGGNQSQSMNIDDLIKKLDENGYGIIKKDDLNKVNQLIDKLGTQQNQQNQHNQHNQQNNQVDISSKILEGFRALEDKISKIESNVLNNISTKNKLDQLLSEIPDGNMDIAKTLIDSLPADKAIEKINELNLTIPRNGAYNTSRSIEVQKGEAEKYANTDIAKRLGLTSKDFENGLDNGAKIMNDMEQAFTQIQLVGVNGAAEIIKSSLKGDK